MNFAPVSKKVIAQALGHGAALVAGYLAVRHGTPLGAASSAEIAGLASMLAGPAAGWLAKEEPRVEDVANKVLDTLAKNGLEPGTAGSMLEKAVDTGS